MRTILVLMDTLRRDILSPYNEEAEAITPNLDAFAEESCVFDEHWIGSAPCMPARRDILCGRLNFLERSWGPIEPFDTTLPALLKEHNIFTHITTDHCHYLRLGGENYLQQFNTWDYHRGQEGDPWISLIDDPSNMPETYYGRVRKQYQQNRQMWPHEEDMPSPKTFASACDWVKTNGAHDDFFLMVEAFDPHEPFDVPESYMEQYGPVPELDRDYFEIPPYSKMDENDIEDTALAYLRRRYLGLVSMTDAWFGKLISTLKEQGLYDDTLIMVTTDHGYFLGEKDFLGKNIMPLYNELAHLPLMVHVPGNKNAGKHTRVISQAIDIMPTVLDYAGLPIPEVVQGKSLRAVLEADDASQLDMHTNHDYAVFGYHGMDVNICDGQYKYLRAPVASNQPLFEYCAIPYSIRRVMGKDNPEAIQMGRFLPWTNYPVYKIPVKGPGIIDVPGDPLRFVHESQLFDLATDYAESDNLVGKDQEQEARMCKLLQRALTELEAPQEQFERLGLK